MIFKAIKFFIKLGIAIAIGVFIVVVFIVGSARGAKQYVDGFDLGYQDASKIVQMHKEVEKASVGETCICVICMKEKNSTIGAEFVKTTKNMNCCCPEHERQYQEIYKNWRMGNENKENLSKQGVKFK